MAFARVATLLSVAQVPADAVACGLGRLVALQKPSGGVRNTFPLVKVSLISSYFTFCFSPNKLGRRRVLFRHLWLDKVARSANLAQGMVRVKQSACIPTSWWTAPSRHCLFPHCSLPTILVSLVFSPACCPSRRSLHPDTSCSDTSTQWDTMTKPIPHKAMLFSCARAHDIFVPVHVPHVLQLPNAI